MQALIQIAATRAGARHFAGVFSVAVLAIAAGVSSGAQEAAGSAKSPTTAAQAPNSDTSFIDAQGTAHVTRVVPVPGTISAQAQKSLAQPLPKICANELVEAKMAGVPVRIVTPEGMPEGNKDKVLLNLHGGGFNSDSGSYTESIPIASYAKIKVVAVLYRLAPEYPFPAAVDDEVAVCNEQRHS